MCITVNDSLYYKFDGDMMWGIIIDTSIYKSCYNNVMIITDNSVLEITKNDIKISPNPLINSTVITIPENLKLNKIIIDIFDLQGRKIKEFHALKEHKIYIYRADFRDVGLYFVQIKSNDYIETIKLLVQ